MKKILWLLLLFPLFLGRVYASEVYYSDYSEYSPYQEELVLKSDLVEVKEEERYLCYQDSKTLGDYLPYKNNGTFDDDCYETDFTVWSKEEPIAMDNRTYETREKHTYTVSKEVRYVHLTDLHGSYGSFRIPELMIYANGEEIDYDYTCTGCWGEFDKYIHNGNYNENESYIANGGELIIDLKKTYQASDLNVVFYIFDLGQDAKEYTIAYSTDKETFYGIANYKIIHSDEYWINSVRREHKIVDAPMDVWTNEIVTYDEIDPSKIIMDSIETEYRYKEKYCRVIVPTVEYDTTYRLQCSNDYPNRSDKSKTYYSYRTRDKLEIASPLLIEKSNFDLNDFVIYSSNEYKIEDSIDWTKNGDYTVSFKTSNIDVTKPVSVNIQENTIDELKKQFAELQAQYLEEIAKLKQELKDMEEEKNSCIYSNEKNQNTLKKIVDLNQIYENKIFELENRISGINNDIAVVLKEKNQIIEQYEGQIKEYQTAIENDNLQNSEYLKTKDELDKVKEESKELKDKLNDYVLRINGQEKANLVFIYIFILLIAIIYLISRLKRKSNQKNV